MGRVFRFFRRLVVGLCATLGFVMLLGVLGFWIFRSMVQPRFALQETNVLELSLKGDFMEGVAQSPLQQLLEGGKASFYQTLAVLEHASKDPHIPGLFITLDNPGLGLAQIQELRAVFKTFRKNGKFVHMYAQSFGELSPAAPLYYLASAADHISIQPLGMICITGLSIETPFLKGFLDWAGAQAQFAKREAYKSFPEMFTEKKMSEPSRQALTALLQSLSQQLIQGIAEDRKLSPAQVEAAFANAPLSDKEGKEAKLIDTICYEGEALTLAQKKAQMAPVLPFSIYRKRMKQAEGKLGRTKPSVALVFGEGMILQEAPPGMSPLSSDREIIAAVPTLRLFEKLEQDPDIKALVYRIDSGGGHALASDSIREGLQRLRKAGKTVVVSMGNVAASGGYMIALGADRIFAEPATLTGSIGVFGGKLNLEAFWKKFEIGWDGVATHPQASMASLNRSFSEKEFKLLDKWADQLYSHFLTLTATARKLTPEEARAAAQGRVWTGQQAHALKLVDKLGGVGEAILEAKQLARLEPDALVKIYPHPKSFPELILEALSGSGASQEEAQAVLRTCVQGECISFVRDILSGLKSFLHSFGLYPPLALTIE
ncbi:MAG: signal peptide peptidase SppA [Alphaproteobacteria bacterium]